MESRGASEKHIAPCQPAKRADVKPDQTACAIQSAPASQDR